MALAFLDSPIYVDDRARFVGEPKPPEFGTQAFRDQSAVECLDTAGVLRSYRKPQRGETWLTPLKSERRLLAQVDAIIGLGERAIARVEALAFDPDIPDPSRLFAAAFTLGCIDNERWTNSAVSMLIRAAHRTRAELDAVTEALCLSPNRKIAVVLEPLLSHELLNVRAAAIHIMGYRGTLPEDAWHAAIRSGETSLTISALKAMTHNYRTDACRSALLPLYGDDSERILRLAMLAGLRLRSRAAYECAAGIADVDPSRADSLRIVALFGVWADIARVRSVIAGDMALPGMVAAGILGYVDLVPDLFAVIENGEEGSKLSLAAADALRMVIGTSCGEPETLAGAKQFWAAHAGAFDKGSRYRLGKFLSTNLILEQLGEGSWSRKDRQQLYGELMAVTHCRIPPFSPYDFIGAQRLALQTIEQWFSVHPNEHQGVGSLL